MSPRFIVIDGRTPDLHAPDAPAFTIPGPRATHALALQARIAELEQQLATRADTLNADVTSVAEG